MRKALIFITFLLVFCCSAFATAASAAIEGIYDGILAAVASSITVPRVALQGVTVVRDKNLIPVRISFVRSDVSSYSDSLQFFSNGAGSSIMSAISSDAYLSAISGFAIHALNHSDFHADEIVLDGSVRRLDADFIELDDLIYRDNWNGIDGRFSLSMLVTGRLADDGVIVEGTFVIEGGYNRTMTIRAESLKVNNEDYELEPVTLQAAY